MEFFPLFLNLRESRILVFGDSSAAARKIELLLKSGCSIRFVSETLSNKSLASLVDRKEVEYINTQLSDDSVWEGVNYAVAASEDANLDEIFSSNARKRSIPVNVVNRVDLSTFVFPSIIDRSPIIAAVSSGGELPILTRLVRSRLEASLPHALGRLADIAKTYRQQVKDSVEGINARRRFWEQHLEGKFSELIFSGKEDEAKSLIESAVKTLSSSSPSNDGEVYLVGAGPGDPDLLTFKALRLIRQADIVLYDRLVSEPILELVRHDAERINVGKERSNHLVPQESINDLLVKYAKQGKRVLRLKGGDPFIFGRGGEEIETLAEEGVSFQVVPGITAASGCAAYSGIPLTHRDYSQSVRFITGHLKDDSCNLPWHEFVQDNQTLVFYMGLTGLPTISRSLIENGMSPDKPIALVSRGTTRHQKVYEATLSTIVDEIKDKRVVAPTLIIIGDVVSLREKLNWHE